MAAYEADAQLAHRVTEPDLAATTVAAKCLVVRGPGLLHADTRWLPEIETEGPPAFDSIREVDPSASFRGDLLDGRWG